MSQSFTEALREQRWDDHRFYHRSYVNQSLHFVSACCFLISYVFLFVAPVVAVMIGWTAAMLSRQLGHFAFEPKGYDEVNRATHAYKESIKVGYNLRRKIGLLSVGAAAAAVVAYDATVFGWLEAPADTYGFLTNLSIVWATVAAGGLLFRMLQLFVLADVQTGLVWVTKILTDPFHDVKIYHRSPLRLLRGERLDPMEPWAA